MFVYLYLDKTQTPEAVSSPCEREREREKAKKRECKQGAVNSDLAVQFEKPVFSSHCHTPDSSKLTPLL